MSTTEKLQKLASLVFCTFTLDMNASRGFYESPEEAYNDLKERDVEPDIVGEIDWTKQVWNLRVYMKTPISFYDGISNDVDVLLDWAIAEAQERYDKLTPEDIEDYKIINGRF